MKAFISTLLVVVLCGIGLDVFIRQKRETPPVRAPIGIMVRDMAKNGGITADKAKVASLLLFKELWVTEPNAKVQSCEWDKNGHNWIVTIWVDNPIAGGGCKVAISEAGYVKNVELLMGE